ncbi:MAG: S8 family serine peptidase [Chthoniobacteraceae bacterium]
MKPEIVMEGGNIALTQSGEYVGRGSLEPITTSPRFLSGNPLSNIIATSSATASASRLGAMLIARMPGYWPETYRGLIVHSARWLPAMLSGIDPHQPRNAHRVQSILRSYGFGEPHQPRLFGSGESGVTMIIQDLLQPYNPNAESGRAGLHHFHLHHLPWPQDVFDQHRDLEMTLRVTLSYFIEPNPGSRCWQGSQKYRYASHLLRFSFKRSTESDAVFRQSLERRILEDEEEDAESNTAQERRAPADSKWALGPKLRGKSGSVVHDIWKGSPAELAQMGQVAIYPAKGWFATRTYQPGHEYFNCHQRPVRYSLIISLDAEQEIGLYTSISNIISIDA